MENKTKTLRDYFNELLTIEAVNANAELVDFINGRIAQLDKKSDRVVPDKNAQLKVLLLNQMEVGHAYTATAAGQLIGISCQKASALLVSLVRSKQVSRVENKKSVVFIKEA